MSDDVSQARPRGVYWLPNLLTTGALFAGFYAIVAAIDLRFDHAGIAVFVVSTFDTDYLLVKADQLEAGVRALEGAGHRVTLSDAAEHR